MRVSSGLKDNMDNENEGKEKDDEIKGKKEQEGLAKSMYPAINEGKN